MAAVYMTPFQEAVYMRLFQAAVYMIPSGRCLYDTTWQLFIWYHLAAVYMRPLQAAGPGSSWSAYGWSAPAHLCGEAQEK